MTSASSASDARNRPDLAATPLPLDRHLGTIERVLDEQRIARLLARLRRRRLALGDC